MIQIPITKYFKFTSSSTPGTLTNVFSGDGDDTSIMIKVPKISNFSAQEQEIVIEIQKFISGSYVDICKQKLIIQPYSVCVPDILIDFIIFGSDLNPDIIKASFSNNLNTSEVIYLTFSGVKFVNS